MNVVSFRPVDQVEEIFEGLNVTEIPRDRYTEDEIIEYAQGAEALFVHSENKYTRRVLENLESLQVIGKPGPVSNTSTSRLQPSETSPYSTRRDSTRLR